MTQGASSGTSSQAPFDRWFRYPAGFSKGTLNVAYEALELKPGNLVVDPFAGVGTTGVGARKRGLAFRGIEAHPLIAEFAALKFARPADPAGLISSARHIAEGCSPASLKGETDLLIKCFKGATLRQLIQLRDRIVVTRGPWRPYLRCALSATLRELSSSKVGWPHQRPSQLRRPRYADATKRFLQRAELMAEDLGGISGQEDCAVVAGDAQDHDIWALALGRKKANGCLSSPPYLNNFDYADATRLELYFWGYARTWAQMCAYARRKMITSTTQQATVSSAQESWTFLARCPETFSWAKRTAQSLAQERRVHPGAKAYDRVLPAYLAGLARVLQTSFKYLSPGSKLVWTVGDSAPYGVYINTPKVIAKLAGEIGFTFNRDVRLRMRGERWASNGTRHRVPLSERLIVMVRP